MPTATRLVKHEGTGKLVSHRNMSGDSACSGAASAWRLGKATHETYVLLAKCRKAAAGHRQRKLKESSGKIAPGRETPLRLEKAATLKKSHADRLADKAAQIVAGKPPVPAPDGFALKPAGAASKPGTPSLFGRPQANETAPATPTAAGFPAPLVGRNPGAPGMPETKGGDRPKAPSRSTPERMALAARMRALKNLSPAEKAALHEAAINRHVERMAGQLKTPAAAQSAIDDIHRSVADGLEYDVSGHIATLEKVKALLRDRAIASDKAPGQPSPKSVSAAPAQVPPQGGAPVPQGGPSAPPFGLKQESAAGRKAPAGFFDTGRGRTGTMFDMKRGDLPGQTSLLEQVPAVDTRTGQAEGKAAPADPHAQELERRAKISAMPPAERMKHAFDPASNSLNVGGDQVRNWLKDATPADLDAIDRWTDTLPPANRSAARRWIGGEVSAERRVREQRAPAKALGSSSSLPGGTRPELIPAQIEKAVAEHRAARAAESTKLPRADRLASLAGKLERHREKLANKAGTPGNPLHNRNVEVYGRARQIAATGRRVGEELGKEIRGEVSPIGETARPQLGTTPGVRPDVAINPPPIDHEKLAGFQREIASLRQSPDPAKIDELRGRMGRELNGWEAERLAARELGKGTVRSMPYNQTARLDAIHGHLASKLPAGAMESHRAAETEKRKAHDEHLDREMKRITEEKEAKHRAMLGEHPFGAPEPQGMTANSIRQMAQAKYEPTADEHPGDREVMTGRHAAALALEHAPKLPEGDFISLMKGEQRRDMARGNAVKLVQQAAGLTGAKGKAEAEKHLEGIAPTRTGSAHFSPTIGNGYQKPTAGITKGFDFLPAEDVYRAAHRAAVGSKGPAPDLRAQADATAKQAREIPHTPGTPNPAKRELVNRARDLNHAANLEAAKGASGVVLKSDEPTGVNTMLVHPSTRERGRFQLSKLDHEGQPVGHATFDTKEQAIASASGMHVGPEPPHGHSGFKVTEATPAPKPGLKDQVIAHRAATWSADPAERKELAEKRKIDRRTIGRGRIIAGSGEFSHRSPGLGARVGDQVAHEEDKSLHGRVVGRDEKNRDILTVRRPDGREFKALRSQLVLPRERLAGRYSPERQARAAQIRTERAQGNYGTARQLRERPLNHDQVQAEARANRVKRAEKNVELIREHLAKGGTAPIASMMKPALRTDPSQIVGVDRDGSIRIASGRSGKTVALTGGDQTRIFAHRARMAKAAELKARRAATPPPAPATPASDPASAYKDLVSRAKAGRATPAEVSAWAKAAKLTPKELRKLAGDVGLRLDYRSPGKLVAVLKNHANVLASGLGAAPSLKDQAAEHRAEKGTAEERAGAIGDRLRKRADEAQQALLNVGPMRVAGDGRPNPDFGAQSRENSQAKLRAGRQLNAARDRLKKIGQPTATAPTPHPAAASFHDLYARARKGNATYPEIDAWRRAANAMTTAQAEELARKVHHGIHFRGKRESLDALGERAAQGLNTHQRLGPGFGEARLQHARA